MLQYDLITLGAALTPLLLVAAGLADWINERSDKVRMPNAQIPNTQLRCLRKSSPAGADRETLL